jgi:hypothetical protein
MIRVIRIGRERGNRPGADIADLVMRLTDRDRHWWYDLPAPHGDHYLVTGNPATIRDHQSCCSVDMQQFRRWWPEWAVNALASPDAEHDGLLTVWDCPEYTVEVLAKQTLFIPSLATCVRRVALAGSRITMEEIEAMFLNQNAHDVARGDRYASLNLNA